MRDSLKITDTCKSYIIFQRINNRNEIVITVKDYPDICLLSINKDQATQIIEHLKKEFNLLNNH